MTPRLRVILLCQGVAALLLLGFSHRQYREHADAPARKIEQCRRNLRLIHDAVQAYRRDRGGAYPLVLESIRGHDGVFAEGLYPQYLRDRAVLVCPAAPEAASVGPLR